MREAGPEDALPEASRAAPRAASSGRRRRAIISPMRPSSVLRAGGDRPPRAPCRAPRSCPVNTMVPRSASGASSATRRARVLAGRPTLSPVSAASSAAKSMVCTRRASAGTKSPASSSRMSPGTTLLGGDDRRPCRRGARARSARSCSAARRAPPRRGSPGRSRARALRMTMSRMAMASPKLVKKPCVPSVREPHDDRDGRRGEQRQDQRVRELLDHPQERRSCAAARRACWGRARESGAPRPRATAPRTG